MISVAGVREKVMDGSEIEENPFVSGEAKLHGDMCRMLSAIVYKVLAIFPVLEASRPRSKSGIQGLCSLHVALDKAKNLLQHCSDCSKLYLAITGDSLLMKFEKARFSLQESLACVKDIVPQAIGCQIMEIVNELEQTVFKLDESEKQVGEEVIALLQDRKYNSSPNDNGELEIFHQAALKLCITSSKAALTERRALKKLIERAHVEEDRRKESIVSYLLHLMRKYSKIFRSDMADDTDSQGSAPCTPTVLGSFEEISGSGGCGHAFDRHLSKLSSFNFKQSGMTSGNMPIPPEEFRCPISLQLMHDPVIISSGQTYERACIEKWFNDGHSTCPKTQQQLPHLCLTPNYCVKGLIAGWCEQNGVPIPEGPPESLDTSYWKLALSECEVTNSTSIGSINSCKLKGVEVFPLEENGSTEEVGGNDIGSLDGSSCQDCADDLETYEGLLALLYEGSCMRKQCRAVEQIRFLLKDNEEARICMGANGFIEGLVQFLLSALNEGDEKAQEVGAMALFNLCVNNNRNRRSLLFAGVIPLLEQMILNPGTYESSTALYLSLSFLEEAKSIVGSSQAVPFLVQLLQSKAPNSSSCKHDALYTLYNLSTHHSNIPSLLSFGVIDALHSLLMVPAWAEKAVAVFINLASSKQGKKKIISTIGLINTIAAMLDTGEPIEQEQTVCCLLTLCNGDEKCSQLVLQEGVIPALVSVSVSGTPRGREKAQRLLKLFREQRQHDPSPTKMQQQNEHIEAGGDDGMVPQSKPLCKSRSKKLGRTLSSMWKNRGFPVYHC